jgi:hypothetical protein
MDVHRCTNALKDRTSEKVHPEHKSLLLLAVIIGFFLGKSVNN